MKKLMSLATCMIFVVLLMSLPCFSQEEGTQPTPEKETSMKSEETTTPENQETASMNTDEENSEITSEITIQDAAICRDIVDREPVGVGDVFSTELKKVVCFTRVVGAKQDTEILHNWYFAEKMMASVALHVGSDNWRTYSSKAIVPEYAGEWKVEVLSQEGELLKKIYFILE